MARAKKERKETSVAAELTATDRREFAEFLSASHDELGLWRKCTRARCRRERRCRGEIDECGAACAPEQWAGVRKTVAGMREGQSCAAAARAAQAADQRPLVVIDYGELGEYVFEVDDEGKWTLISSSGPPGPGSDEITRAEWERIAPKS
jgi:hypothetical protein